MIVSGRTEGISLIKHHLKYPVQERPTDHTKVYPDVLREDVEISTICIEIRGDYIENYVRLTYLLTYLLHGAASFLSR